MRHITQDGLNLIKQFESFSSTVYFCSAGYPAIGYGHGVKEHENFSCGISEEEANDLLESDIIEAEKIVQRLINVPLTEGQFDSLVSFTYNMGGEALQRSTLRHKVNRAEHTEVPEEFIRWIWADGKKSRRLIRRRTAEAALYQKST